jgi:hypothetical protein
LAILIEVAQLQKCDTTWWPDPPFKTPCLARGIVVGINGQAMSRLQRQRFRRQKPSSQASSDARDDRHVQTSPRQRRLYAAAIFLLLLACYLANGDILPGNDATGSVRLAGKLVTKHKLVFTPQEDPFMFDWRLRTPDGQRPATFRSWHSTLNGEPIHRAYERGDLTSPEPCYFLMNTRQPGVYASRYGVGAGLFAVPFVAAAYPFARDLYDRPSAEILWSATKLAASCAVAGTAVLLFLAALASLRPGTAAALALAFGMGTSAWSSSSQALWQHGPTGFFLALGTYFLLRRGRPSSAYWVGLSYGMAFACRPTAGIALATVGAYFLRHDRRALLRCVVGCLPVLVPLAAYNLHFFGRLAVFGQVDVGAVVPAGAKAALFDLVPTATAAPTSTLIDSRYLGRSLLEGLAGVLISPSRGLLVFSPVVLVAFWGLARAFKDERYSTLRPVAVAAPASALLVAGWFSWWGGWSYGPRLMSDTMVLLAFLAIPVAEQVRNRRALTATFGLALAWSVAVQIVGAFAYDIVGWNSRQFFAVRDPTRLVPAVLADRGEAQREAWAHGGTVEECMIDVNSSVGHARLWSIRDNQIFFYVAVFFESRRLKQVTTEEFLRTKG